jgi:hypothetical protein
MKEALLGEIDRKILAAATEPEQVDYQVPEGNPEAHDQRQT